LPLLHEAISEGLAEAVDDIQTAGALQLGEGWMHIHGKRSTLIRQHTIAAQSSLTPFPCDTAVGTDERNIPPLNRIGDPDDILASVRVQDGKASLFPS
jgi:hypothetical protein